MKTISQLFSETYKAYYEKIKLYICYRCDYNEEVAKDIAQNVFLTLWQEMKKRNDLPAEKMSAWLRTVADFRLSDYYKKRNAQRKRTVYLETVTPDYFSVIYDMDEEIKKEIFDRNIDRYIEKALNELTSDEYEFYKLAFVNHLKYSEISEQLGISECATRVRIYRIRQKVKLAAEKILKNF